MEATANYACFTHKTQPALFFFSDFIQNTNKKKSGQISVELSYVKFHRLRTAHDERVVTFSQQKINV